MTSNRLMGEEDVVHLSTGILCNHKKKRKKLWQMEYTRNHYAERMSWYSVSVYVYKYVSLKWDIILWFLT